MRAGKDRRGRRKERARWNSLMWTYDKKMIERMTSRLDNFDLAVEKFMVKQPFTLGPPLVRRPDGKPEKADESPKG